jgi:hypothetical protein
MYRFQLTDLVKTGHVTLKPGFEADAAPKTWEAVKKLAA